MCSDSARLLIPAAGWILHLLLPGLGRVVGPTAFTAAQLPSCPAPQLPSSSPTHLAVRTSGHRDHHARLDGAARLQRIRAPKHKLQAAAAVAQVEAKCISCLLQRPGSGVGVQPWWRQSEVMRRRRRRRCSRRQLVTSGAVPSPLLGCELHVNHFSLQIVAAIAIRSLPGLAVTIEGPAQGQASLHDAGVSVQ